MAYEKGLIYDGECFLCGRKDMTLIDGELSPMLGYVDIPVKYCIECVKQMHADYERFFEGLDWQEILSKYYERFDAIVKSHIEQKRKILEE